MQIIVTSNDRWDFDKAVSAKLDGEYNVVPGPLTIAVAMTHKGPESYQSSESLERYAVILER